ncbi:WhiB family transcriptional regulator [Rhodococcus jostii]
MASQTLTVRLRKPLAELWEWQRFARCASINSDVFFAPEGEGRAARAYRETTAKDFCRSCAVRSECRNHALIVGEPFGVWGGLSEADRRYIASGILSRADAAQDHTRKHGNRQSLNVLPSLPPPGRHR